MKNTQKGYIVPALLGIIALLIIAFITYIYNDKGSRPAAATPTGTENPAPEAQAQEATPGTPAVTTTSPSATGEVPNATTSAALPNIANINPTSVPLLTAGFKINGTQLDAVSDNSSGWPAKSHIFVKITNGGNQTGILWEGGSTGGKASSPNQIEVGAIPKSICMVSEVGAGPCPADKKMEVTPGKYNLYVTVEGRGTSNTLPLTVIAAAQ